MEASREAEERYKAPRGLGCHELYTERRTTDGDGRCTIKREDRRRHRDELRVLRSVPGNVGGRSAAKSTAGESSIRSSKVRISARSAAQGG